MKGIFGSYCCILCGGIVCNNDENDDNNSNWYLLCVDIVLGFVYLGKVIYFYYFI